jgi:hypothetical protein
VVALILRMGKRRSASGDRHDPIGISRCLERLQTMYIGLGTVVVILIIVLIIMMLRGRA